MAFFGQNINKQEYFCVMQFTVLSITLLLLHFLFKFISGIVYVKGNINYV